MLETNRGVAAFRLLKNARLLRCATSAYEKVRLIPHDVLQAGV
jgi:hypothetical protein